MAGETQRRPLLVSRVWVQGAILVTLCGFFILGLLAYRTYASQPPIPETVVDQSGGVVYTGEDIQKGQQIFLHNGLMEYGSAFGHGAYLGPGLHRRLPSPLRRPGPAGLRGAAIGRRGAQTMQDFRTNRYEERTGTLTLTAAQADAFRRLVPYYSRFFSERRPGTACPPTPSPIRPSSASSRRSSPGRPGPRRPIVPATTTRTRTTGRPSRASTTRRRPT